jgi:hypothetical protein
MRYLGTKVECHYCPQSARLPMVDIRRLPDLAMPLIALLCCMDRGVEYDEPCSHVKIVMVGSLPRFEERGRAANRKFGFGNTKTTRQP